MTDTPLPARWGTTARQRQNSAPGAADTVQTRYGWMIVNQSVPVDGWEAVHLLSGASLGFELWHGAGRVLLQVAGNSRPVSGTMSLDESKAWLDRLLVTGDTTVGVTA